MSKKRMKGLFVLVVAFVLVFAVSTGVASAMSNWEEQGLTDCAGCHDDGRTPDNPTGAAAEEPEAEAEEPEQEAQEEHAALAEEATASEEAEELPKTGGNPYTYVVIGAIIAAAGLALARKRIYSE